MARGFHPSCLATSFIALVGIINLALMLAGGGGGGAVGPPGPPGPFGSIDINNAAVINARTSNVTVSGPPVVDFQLRDQNGDMVVNLPAGSRWAGDRSSRYLWPGRYARADSWQRELRVVPCPAGWI